MNLDNLLHKIDDNRQKINDYRSLSPEEAKELDQYYKVGTTYSSNALEGNTLTLTETKVLLEDGLTAGGKPVKDFYEATGHAKAYDYMLSVARGGELVFSEAMIEELHRLFYEGIDSENAGKYRDHQVFITGTDYIPPEAKDVPEQMQWLITDLNEQKGNLHPVLLAAYAHRALVDIHPFTDGNGRTARLLMNLVLVNKGYCIVSIPPVMRQEYISALVAAQREDNPTDEPFSTLIADCELEAQKDYVRMFRIQMDKE